MTARSLGETGDRQAGRLLVRTDARIVLQVPMRLWSRKNDRLHWALRRRREKPQEIALWANLLAAIGGNTKRVPRRATFVRIGAHLLDTDNLPLSCSHLRDCVARTFGVDDGPTGPIEWCYGQRKGPWTVELTLEFEGGA